MKPDPKAQRSFFSRNRKAFLDAAVIALIVLLSYAVTAAFDLWERLNEWTRGFEQYNVDELLFTLFVVALSLAYVAYRRWAEYRVELNVRRAVEARAAQAHNRLIDAVESIPASFMLFDSRDRLVLYNSKTAEFFPELADRLAPGVPFEDLARIGVDRGLVPAAAGREEEWLASRLAMHREPHDAFEEERAGGRWLQVLERKTSDGGTVGICTDITEIKSHEADLRQAQKMEAVGRLTGGVAHDFNNLLTIILGNLQMLEDCCDDGGPTSELLREAQAASERGAGLTERLLAFARRQPLAPRPVDLGALIGGMADLLRRTLGDPIEVETAVATDLWSAVADPGQVENAILNLAINARDAMPRGGTLHIAAANVHIDAAYTERHGDARPGDYVMVAVRDTGVGMSPEVAERAFEPYFTTKALDRGTGLGLSMIYGFAKQSGGHVTIESEEGRGAAVRLYLPRSQAPPVAAAAPAPEEFAAVAGTVLVVEDDAGVRRFAARALRDQGFDVLVAGNGREALGILDAQGPVDLLFTDVLMPGGVSGWDLARQARRRWPEVKVLLASGNPEDRLGDGAVVPDSVDLVRKPYKKSDLARTIRRLMAPGAS